MRAALEQFARQGRSFYFASRFLPPAERARVAAVYAYCRTTDDLVDEAGDLSRTAIEQRLHEWHAASRAAYDGTLSGDAVIDAAMTDMRSSGIPFRYAAELIDGMRMDIVPERYADFTALGRYTYRVAGVVGLWMTAMFDVHESWILERAVSLGRGMQLTNIARDVGDDWRRGRLYLPLSLLRSYGVAEQDLDAMCSGKRPIPPAFRAVMEALITTADAEYRRAFEAIPFLPPAFRRTVAVAAEVYRGIHAEIRRAGYDTVTRRATTSFGRKCLLAADGLRSAGSAAAGTGATARPFPRLPHAYPSTLR